MLRASLDSVVQHTLCWKLRKFCSCLFLVLEVERTASSALKVPSSRVKAFRLPRETVVNGVTFLRCG